MEVTTGLPVGNSATTSHTKADKSHRRKFYHTKRIGRFDGDTQLSINERFLKSQLKRAYHHSQDALQSCIQKFSTDWTLTPSGGRRAIFCVLETEEKLLAARYRIGQDHQLIVVGSASKHGFFGSRVKLLTHTKELAEPVLRDGKSWRRDIWHVWDPFAKHSNTEKCWPSVVRLLEIPMDTSKLADSGCCSMPAEAQSDSTTQYKRFTVPVQVSGCGQDLSSDTDSDVPLRQKQRNPAVNGNSSDSEEDVPLRELRKLAGAESPQHNPQQKLTPLIIERKPSVATCRSRSGSPEAYSIASSSMDNKDYQYWQVSGLVDHSIQGLDGLC